MSIISQRIVWVVREKPFNICPCALLAPWSSSVNSFSHTIVLHANDRGLFVKLLPFTSYECSLISFPAVIVQRCQSGYQLVRSAGLFFHSKMIVSPSVHPFIWLLSRHPSFTKLTADSKHQILCGDFCPQI